jgi:hypothetical protein
MKRYNNEKGIALVTALLLTLISLTFVLSLLYMLTQGVKTSASTKHYATALEAAYGGVDFITKDALPQMLSMKVFDSDLFKAHYPAYLNMTLKTKSTDTCMHAKLISTPDQWLTHGCSAANLTSDISLLKDTMDMTFTFPGTLGSSGYTVYSKIVSTPQIGNTDTSMLAGMGLTGGVVANLDYGGEGREGAATIIPYMYSIQVQAEAAANPREKTRLTLLYAF